MAYTKSFNEIAIINLLDTERSDYQKVINIRPYVFECFVKTEVDCNQTLFYKKREQESHIFFLATRDGALYLLDLRVDALRQMSEKDYSNDFSTSIREMTCDHGHPISRENRMTMRCSLCNTLKSGRHFRCSEDCNWAGCKECYKCSDCYNTTEK